MDRSTATVTCNRCGEPIVWVTTARNGRRMPIDPEPTETGSFVLRDGRAVRVSDEERRTALRDGEAVWRAHAARCGRTRPAVRGITSEQAHDLAELRHAEGRAYDGKGMNRDQAARAIDEARRVLAAQLSATLLGVPGEDPRR